MRRLQRAANLVESTDPRYVTSVRMPGLVQRAPVRTERRTRCGDNVCDPGLTWHWIVDLKTLQVVLPDSDRARLNEVLKYSVQFCCKLWPCYFSLG